MSDNFWPAPSLDLPTENQLQVDVFGPGVGECIVVHLGSHDWLVVDSCKGRGHDWPAALEYFDAVGAPANAVKLIVATHWHDDHVKGIATIFESYPEAEFYVAESVRPSEFLAVTGQEPMSSRFTTGVEELSRGGRIADERQKPVRGVGPASRIFHRSSEPVSAIWTLSPSYEELRISRMHLAALLPTFRPGARRIPAQQPNDTSVVLLLETPLGALLLGGDLEHPADRLRGWHAVLDLASAPQDKASLFKLPHHGSINGHCPEVWEHRMEDDAIAVLTPFDRGATPLPRPSDLERIRSLTSRAFVTSDKRDLAIRRDRVTSKTIKEMVRSYRPQLLRMGHVQFRAVDGAWQVSVSEEAVAV